MFVFCFENEHHCIKCSFEEKMLFDVLIFFVQALIGSVFIFLPVFQL